MNIPDGVYDDDKALFDWFCEQAGERLPHFDEVVELGIRTVRYPIKGSLEGALSDAIERSTALMKPIFVVYGNIMTVVSSTDDAGSIASHIAQGMPSECLSVSENGTFLLKVGQPKSKGKKPF